MRNKKRLKSVDVALLRELWADVDYSAQETAHMLGVCITSLDALVKKHNLRTPKPYKAPPRTAKKDPTQEEIAAATKAIREKNLKLKRAAPHKPWTGNSFRSRKTYIINPVGVSGVAINCRDYT